MNMARMTRRLIRMALFCPGVGLLLIGSTLLLWQQLNTSEVNLADKLFHDDGDELLVTKKRWPNPLMHLQQEEDFHNYTDTALQATSQDDEPATDNCRNIPPWLAETGELHNVHLIFYGKPIMYAVRKICIERQWKMTLIINDTSKGLQELERHISSNSLTIIITSSRTLRHQLIQQLANSTKALVSAIRYAFKVTGPKKGQLDSFRNKFQLFGCQFSEAGIMPTSFILDYPNECVQFFRYANLNPDLWWVLKTSQGYGGEGISIHSNMTQLYQKFGKCDQTGFVIQEYLPNLLLVEGRKFDIRALVLIAGTNPYLLFFHEGYLRVSVQKFEWNGSKAVHLTNSHVQVESKGFSLDKHFWSIHQFREYISHHHPENADFVDSQLVPFIKKISLFILQTAMDTFSRMPSTFQLLGLDFMVTSDFRVWFIEANNYPLWPRGTSYIEHMIDEMGNDMFDLLIQLRQSPATFAHMQPGDHFLSWQLIWSELDAKCSNEPTYNPCKEF